MSPGNNDKGMQCQRESKMGSVIKVSFMTLHWYLVQNFQMEFRMFEIPLLKSVREVFSLCLSPKTLNILRCITPKFFAKNIQMFYPTTVNIAKTKLMLVNPY